MWCIFFFFFYVSEYGWPVAYPQGVHRLRSINQLLAMHAGKISTLRWAEHSMFCSNTLFWRHNTECMQISKPAIYCKQAQKRKKPQILLFGRSKPCSSGRVQVYCVHFHEWIISTFLMDGWKLKTFSPTFPSFCLERIWFMGGTAIRIEID